MFEPHWTLVGLLLALASRQIPQEHCNSKVFLLSEKRIRPNLADNLRVYHHFAPSNCCLLIVNLPFSYTPISYFFKKYISHSIPECSHYVYIYTYSYHHVQWPKIGSRGLFFPVFPIHYIPRDLSIFFAIQAHLAWKRGPGEANFAQAKEEAARALRLCDLLTTGREADSSWTTGIMVINGDIWVLMVTNGD